MAVYRPGRRRCIRPIRLSGIIRDIDTTTGEILPDLDTGTLPDQAIYVPCGDRRASVCPRLVAPLKAHRATQLHERMTAGPAWHDGDFVWCQPNGRPIGAHADWDEWNALLIAAAIRRVRIHDARHTAATLLLAQGVDQRVVMEILGHSQISMTSNTPMSCRRS